jgi:predicted acylesterase/phospholipase RssA
MKLTDCNLALKGGVTSGLVYAGAVPELAKSYRFRGVSGSSAGAIAAAFTAAAEYARARGDEGGFERLKGRSAELPSRLRSLFQPSPGLRPLGRALIHLAPGTGRARIGAALMCFWPALLAGAVGGVAAWSFLAGGPGLVRNLVGGGFLGGCGATVGLVVQLGLYLRRAARLNFGICSGLSRSDKPALTDWLHSSLQDIAFGEDASPKVLTFGDLADAEIDLRIVSTNLSTGRGETTPRLGQGLGFRPTEWARQFPAAVIDHLTKDRDREVLPIPASSDLPVLVAVRMSLACPGLMEATPAIGEGGARVWFSDGGLTTNFPFAVFEDDPNPTLALDLDTIHTAPDSASRVRNLDPSADDPPPDLRTLRAFVWSLLVALREGHIKAAARKPGQPARIYQARLRPDEGGMKLDMTPAEAIALIDQGASLGAFVVQSELAGPP